MLVEGSQTNILIITNFIKSHLKFPETKFCPETFFYKVLVQLTKFSQECGHKIHYSVCLNLATLLCVYLYTTKAEDQLHTETHDHIFFLSYVCLSLAATEETSRPPYLSKIHLGRETRQYRERFW